MDLKYSYNDSPICPYCDNTIDIDEWELYDLYTEDCHDETCPYCDKDIEIVSNVSYSFTTQKPEE
jgi:glutaredoxin